MTFSCGITGSHLLGRWVLRNEWWVLKCVLKGSVEILTGDHSRLLVLLSEILNHGRLSNLEVVGLGTFVVIGLLNALLCVELQQVISSPNLPVHEESSRRHPCGGVRCCLIGQKELRQSVGESTHPYHSLSWRA